MTDDSKNERLKSIEASLNKFFKREAEKAKKEMQPHLKRRNQKPEKDVEKACVEWMRNQGWDIQIFESKATFDHIRGFWRNSHMKAGNADCQGTLPSGIACYIEFKAKGKRKTFNNPKNLKQQQFIRQKIKMNSFACVTDSVELLKHTFNTWNELRMENQDKARKFLEESLP